jgi:hypothetical protein
MMNTRATILAAFLACGCTTLPSKEEAHLVPPPSSTRETRIRDIIECVSRARLAYENGEPVEDAQRAILQGRSTVKFFREGRPVVDDQQIPSMWTSSLVPPRGYVQKGISDRYIIYLLERCYVWPRAGEPNQPTTRPMR